MHSLDVLRDLSIVFGVSVLVVLVLHRLRFPTITGFLISGIIVGPYGLALVSDTDRIQALADAGVVLLLFTIGMEFSLASLRRLWGPALAGAGLPLLALALLGGAAAPLLGLERGQGIFLGFLISLSSTVIPLKALADRGQIDSPHGRAATGVAVLQDLLVIPMMLLTPYLAPGAAAAGEGLGRAVLDPALALARAAAVVAGVLVVALWVVPRLLARLAAVKSREVFIISIFLICLGTAWITSAVGLSLALGAFLAGLVISESEYGHQALADMVPFRDSLNSLFFVAVGMLMAPQVLVDHPAQVALSAAGLIVVKCLLIGGVLLLTGQRPTIALQAGLALCQVGEFAFVLMRFGSARGLMQEGESQIFLAASVLTMMVSPLMLAAAPRLLRLVEAWEEKELWRPARDLRAPVDALASLEEHVIIVGYGFNGRNLARVLREIGVSYAVLEVNPETVRAARAEGELILYGDAASPGILERLRGGSARVLVIAISDPVSSRRAVAVARARFPALTIVVRTRYLGEVDQLYGLGAQVVIPEEVETSMEIISRVLEAYGVPREALVKHARRIRAERYGLFRGGRPAAGESGQAGSLAALRPLLAAAEVRLCAVPRGSAADGKSLREIDLRACTGATVLAVLREGDVAANPAPGMRLAAGDGVVLMGRAEEIGAAMEKLSAEA
ncbi:MAG TPA: cation:proton antiporter [Candidatus Polarisedimenticolia bacterium]|nr:cation:proton antiporter [Candidatus Polarisedimenticolia bacterium]